MVVQRLAWALGALVGAHPGLLSLVVRGSDDGARLHDDFERDSRAHRALAHAAVARPACRARALRVARVLCDDFRFPDEQAVALALVPAVTVRHASERALVDCFGAPLARLLQMREMHSVVDASTRERGLALVHWKLVVVELAAHLVRMRAIDDADAPERRRLVELAERVFIPLAQLMGLRQVQIELGELALRSASPEVHARISASLERRARELWAAAERVERCVASVGAVSKRLKSVYSIHKKMARAGVRGDIGQVTDLIALRVIIGNGDGDDSDECYAVLARLLRSHHALPGSLKDYIALPKPNGYRSLHVTVMSDGVPVEVQIRTRAMHEDAELGAASHLLYKTPDFAPLVAEWSLLPLARQGGGAAAASRRRVVISAIDRPRLLMEITTFVAAHAENIVGFRSFESGDRSVFVFVVDVREQASLLRLQWSARDQVAGVLSVRVTEAGA